MTKSFRCRLSVCVSPANPPLDTQLLFDIHYKESTDSPIDEFLTRLQSINKLSPHPSSFDSFQGQLVLLGVVAAVESFLRTLFRRLIAIDAICQESVNRRDVSYGAAVHLSKELLPEAILERISFVSRKNIVEAIKELLGVNGNLPPDLETAIRDYVRVCQLRHCTVHRFGKLGTSNAISLGLMDHKALLEKPLKLNYVALQNSIAISTGLVKTINNFLFNEMISRIPDAEWTGVYAKDKLLFGYYYKIFSDKVSAIRSANASQIYGKFLKQRNSFKNNIPF